MSNDKITYEIVEKNEENSLFDKVVKKGMDIEFQMSQMDDFTNAAVQRLDEMRGKLNLEAAKMQNVMDNHDDAISLVRDLDPVKQEAIRIWLNSKHLVDGLAPKRDEMEEALKEHEAEVEEIKKQTGWEPLIKETENDEADQENSEEVEPSEDGKGKDKE